MAGLVLRTLGRRRAALMPFTAGGFHRSLPAVRSTVRNAGATASDPLEEARKLSEGINRRMESWSSLTEVEREELKTMGRNLTKILSNLKPYPNAFTADQMKLIQLESKMNDMAVNLKAVAVDQAKVKQLESELNKLHAESKFHASGTVAVLGVIGCVVVSSLIEMAKQSFVADDLHKKVTKHDDNVESLNSRVSVLEMAAAGPPVSAPVEEKIVLDKETKKGMLASVMGWFKG